MSRPPLEVADIVRSAGAAFIERNRQWIGWKHIKVLLAIVRCRTAALGGYVDECTRSGHRATRRLAPLVLQNKKVIYDLLFRTSAETRFFRPTQCCATIEIGNFQPNRTI